MEVIEVKPHGYCQGVMDAIKLAISAQTDNPDKTCYLLGGIVHNEDTIAFFKERGFVLLDEKGKSLEELIETIPEGDVVIFSAHGHPRKLEEIAKRKKLIVYDATCPFVTANMRMAEHSKGKDVIYVGVKGHAEAEAFLANEDVAGFFDTNSKVLEEKKSDVIDPLIIGQTTLSKREFDEAYEEILKKHQNAIEGLARCRSTTDRQEALRKAAREGGVVVVLGSKTSNNSQKLFEIGVEEGNKTYLVLGLEELKGISFDKSERIILSSGASTSSKTFDECLEYLQNL